MIKEILSQIRLKIHGLPGIISKQLTKYSSIRGTRTFTNQESLICNVRHLSIIVLFKLRPFYQISQDRIQSTIFSRNMASFRSIKPSSSNHSRDNTETNKSSNSEKDKPKFSATKEELKARLSPIQYQVTQLKSTER